MTRMKPRKKGTNKIAVDMGEKSLTCWACDEPIAGTDYLHVHNVVTAMVVKPNTRTFKGERKRHIDCPNCQERNTIILKEGDYGKSPIQEFKEGLSPT